MSQVTLIGILGLVAVAACWVLAIVLYRVSSAGSVARKLAVLLVIEGVVLVTAGFPLFAFGVPLSIYETNAAFSFLSSLVHHLGDALMIALYPPFLAFALNTKLTRPFAKKPVRLGLFIVSIAFGLSVVFIESRIITTVFYSTITLLFMYSLIASIQAWHTANRGIVRKRAGIFALAFGIRDIGWGMSYAIAAWVMWTQPGNFVLSNEVLFGKLVYSLGTLLAIPLIAYGVLRTQLFDIDLRIRWTIKQSTIAGIFVATMFLISEGASTFLSAELGNVAGLLAAAVVMFFLAPLQSFADRVASAAMPNTNNTPEYAAFRKMQVYEAALIEALQEGGISHKERSLLERLRDSLGITESDAEAIEGELQAEARR